MSTETALAISQPVKASDQLATFLGIEKGMMLETLKAQCFPGKRPDEVTDTQLAAFVSTANVLQVNPLIPGMLYAYPSKNGGVVPILGPDGTFKKLDEHIAAGKLEGFECVVFPEDVTQKPTHATATIYRKGAKAATYTALYSEWVVSGSPVWGSKPRHMLWTRAIKQAARQVIHGLPMDAEEYHMSEMANVTPEAEQPAAVRPPPKPRAAKGAAAVAETPKPVQTVEAEIVPEPPKAEPVANLAKPAAPEPKVETFAQAAEASAPEPVATPPAEAPAPRAFLNDGETISVIVRVTELKAGAFVVEGVSTPGVKAKVSGGFVGEVRHIGGAKAVPIGAATTYEALPPWAVKAEINVVLVGKKNSKGTVEAYVQTAEAVPEEF